MFSVLETTSKDTTFLQSMQLNLVQTEEDIAQAIRYIQSKTLLAFDIETSGLSFLYDKLAGFSFGDETTGYYVPVNHAFEDNVSEADMLRILDVLKDKSLIYHNSKFDWGFILQKYGIDLPITHDTLAIAALINSDEKDRLGLKHLVHVNLGIEMLELKDDLDTYDFTTVALSDAIYYAIPDSILTFRLFQHLYPYISRFKLGTVYSLELEVIKYVGEMEHNGVSINIDYIRESRPKLINLIKATKAECEKYGDNMYDIDIPSQRADLIYDHLKIPKYKDNAGTSIPILEQLSVKHPIIKKLIYYTHMKKLLSSFFSKAESNVCEDNRIHTEFKQFGTRSGRFSSGGGFGKRGSKIKVNLQQLPKASAGFNFRKAFTVPKGYYWLHSDYSQLEYRTMASLSGEKYLIEAFKAGVDFHSKTASLFMGIPLEKVTKNDRKQGKTLNFGVSYGMSPFGLAQRLRCTPDEAKSKIEKYYQNLPQLKQLVSDIKTFAIKNKFVRTYFGRIRWFRDIPVDKKQRDSYLLKTFNTYVQGSSADLSKMGIAKTFRRLREHPELDIKPILTIHDEINFEVNENISPAVAASFIREAMTLYPEDIEPQPSKIDWVTVRADVSIGTSFGEQVDLEEEDYSSELTFKEWWNLKGTQDVKEKESLVLEPALPSIVLGGGITQRKAKLLSELCKKNQGNYTIYIEESGIIYQLNQTINPTPAVTNNLLDIGFNYQLLQDRNDLAKKIDVASIFASS